MQVGRQKSRFWAYIWLHYLLLTLQQPRCCQYDAAGPPSRKLWHLSLVVSGGVDSEKRRRNVYDKKPQRYTKDDRTAYLTARSDKSVACVTNNKRLCSTFYTVEANYWQTRSNARPLCDSRATCYVCCQLFNFRRVVEKCNKNTDTNTYFWCQPYRCLALGPFGSAIPSGCCVTWPEVGWSHVTSAGTAAVLWCSRTSALACWWRAAPATTPSRPKWCYTSRQAGRETLGSTRVERPTDDSILPSWCTSFPTVRPIHRDTNIKFLEAIL